MPTKCSGVMSPARLPGNSACKHKDCSSSDALTVARHETQAGNMMDNQNNSATAPDVRLGKLMHQRLDVVTTARML